MKLEKGGHEQNSVENPLNHTLLQGSLTSVVVDVVQDGPDYLVRMPAQSDLTPDLKEQVQTHQQPVANVEQTWVEVGEAVQGQTLGVETHLQIKCYWSHSAGNRLSGSEYQSAASSPLALLQKYETKHQRHMIETFP